MVNQKDLDKALSGEMNLSGADLSGADLSGLDEDGLDTGELIYLSGVDLSNADLRNANLEGVELENANLQGTNLDGATFRASFIRDVNFKNATGRVSFSDDDGEGNLDEPDLTTLDTSNLDLSDGYLRGAILNSSQERQRKENWDAMIKREEKMTEEHNQLRRNDAANACYNKNWDALTDEEQESLKFEDVGTVCHECGYSYLDSGCPRCGS